MSRQRPPRDHEHVTWFIATALAFLGAACLWWAAFGEV